MEEEAKHGLLSIPIPTLRRPHPTVGQSYEKQPKLPDVAGILRILRGLGNEADRSDDDAKGGGQADGRCRRGARLAAH